MMKKPINQPMKVKALTTIEYSLCAYLFKYTRVKSASPVHASRVQVSNILVLLPFILGLALGAKNVTDKVTGSRSVGPCHLNGEWLH